MILYSATQRLMAVLAVTWRFLRLSLIRVWSALLKLQAGAATFVEGVANGLRALAPRKGLLRLLIYALARRVDRLARFIAKHGLTTVVLTLATPAELGTVSAALVDSGVSYLVKELTRQSQTAA